MDVERDKPLPVVDFKKTETSEDLATWLGISPDTLQNFISAPREYCEKKRLLKHGSKQRRVVFAANRELRAVHRHIHRSVVAASHDRIPACVHGFVKERSIKTNAEQHLGKKVVLCVDLADFFGSVSIDVVRTLFTSFGSGEWAADALALLCTLDGVLPQGFCSSPSLANLAAVPLDSDFQSLARNLGCAYTRYADDMTFSGDVVPEVSAIEAIVQRHRFRTNPKKTRRQHAGHRQYVTGLTVNDPKAPHLPKTYKRNLRLELHKAAKYGLEAHLRFHGSKREGVEGRILFANGVEPSFGRWLFEQYERATNGGTAPTGNSPDQG